MDLNKPLDPKEWESLKERIMTDIATLIQATIVYEDRLQSLQKLCSETQWYLGEEKARREIAEADLREARNHSQEIQIELEQFKEKCQTA